SARRETIGAECPDVLARAHGVIGAAADRVVLVIDAEQKILRGRESHVVEPRKRLPAGVEEPFRGSVEALCGLILTLTGSERDSPSRQRRRLQLDATGLLHDARLVPAESVAVVAGVAVRAQPVDGDACGIAHPISAAHGGRAAPVALARLRGVAGSGRRRAGGADGNPAGI